MSRLHERFRDHRSAISNADLAEFLFIIYEDIMNKLDALQAAVAAEDTIIDGAVTLLNGIAQQITDAGVDPVALQALVDDVNTRAASLASAVAAVPISGS